MFTMSNSTRPSAIKRDCRHHHLRLAQANHRTQTQIPLTPKGIPQRPKIASRSSADARVIASLTHARMFSGGLRCINRKVDGGLELPAKIVQERLGHSSIVMTMDTYGHLFPSADDGQDGASRAASDRLTRHGCDMDANYSMETT
jgi:hypothetical protein